MADAIEQLRNQAESDLMGLMRRFNRGQRERVADAVRRYGSVEAIPAEFWEGLKSELDTEAAAILLLLITTTYQTELGRMRRKAPPELRSQLAELQGQAGDTGQASDALNLAAADPAARKGRGLADAYVEKTRLRLRKQIDPDAADDEVRRAINDILDDQQAEVVVATETTSTITIGQSSASDDITRKTGVAVDVLWRTERDARVCPICRPLDGKASLDWEKTLAGTQTAETISHVMNGPPAHPNCRCELVHAFAPA